MKTSILSIALMFVSVFSFSQTNLYEHPKFGEYIESHKVVAILPFKTSVKLRPKDMKSMTVEQITKLEEAEGLSVQNAMHSWFLKREKRGTLKTTFMDPVTTNAILRRERITFENYDQFTPQDMADILGVDAVIMGTFETNKPMSEGASLALGLLVGFYGSTNKAVLNMSVYHGEDGLLLANYNKAVSGSIGSSTEDLINILMRKASRRLSYTQ